MPEYISVKGEKTWIDHENQDGIRPGQITIKLLANGKLAARAHVTAASGWKWSFDGLKKYDDTNREIVYTIEEEPVPGYTTIISGYDVVNVYTPASASVDVVKIWNDMNDLDGSRPESVSVSLLANGRVVFSTELNAANDWSASVSDLPMNENGVPIAYTWTEVPVPGYTLHTEQTGSITCLTNTHTPETTQATVRKIWDDDNNALKIRPASIRVKLSNGASVTLSEENGWTATIRDLPVTYRGVRMEYTWTEQEVSGYVLKEKTVNGNNAVFTNTPWQRTVPDQPTRVRRPGKPVLVIDEYETPLALNIDINHVGYCFD